MSLDMGVPPWTLVGDDNPDVDTRAWWLEQVWDVMAYRIEQRDS